MTGSISRRSRPSVSCVNAREQTAVAPLFREAGSSTFELRTVGSVPRSTGARRPRAAAALRGHRRRRGRDEPPAHRPDRRARCAASSPAPSRRAHRSQIGGLRRDVRQLVSKARAPETTARNIFRALGGDPQRRVPAGDARGPRASAPALWRTAAHGAQIESRAARRASAAHRATRRRRARPARPRA